MHNNTNEELALEVTDSSVFVIVYMSITSNGHSFQNSSFNQRGLFSVNNIFTISVLSMTDDKKTCNFDSLILVAINCFDSQLYKSKRNNLDISFLG